MGVEVMCSKRHCCLERSSSSISSMRCTACEAAASFAKSYATPENEKSALSYLDNLLCGKVPAGDRANCSKMLQMTVGNLFSMVSGLTPRRFCEQIGICGAFKEEAVDGIVRVSASAPASVDV